MYPDASNEPRPASTGARPAHATPRPQSKPKIRIFIEGRYQKLVRDLPQTVFFCPECKGRKRRKGRDCERCQGRGKIMKDSVQELVERVILPRYKCWDSKFHGAGREDVDVRMLGTGRPFILELVNPKIAMSDLVEAEQAINREHAGRIIITGLRLVARGRVAELKETKHPKEYQIRVRPASPVPAERIGKWFGQRIQIRQRTPERVAHRRADLDRTRWVELLSMEPVNAADARPGEFLLHVRCEHGTYVKEFVSGEDGRTDPSLAGLIEIPCACVELDVTAILDPEPSAEHS
jgi:tRNA pseudouridine synthase 10